MRWGWAGLGAAIALALLVAALMAGCSRESRWTLWRLAGGEAVAQESGLERAVCEQLRDRGEATTRRADALPGADARVVRYRCRPDGETY